MRALKVTLVLALVLTCLWLDQYTKGLMIQWYQEGALPMYVTSFFNLVLAMNKGVSFGFLSNDSASMPYYMAGFSLLVSFGLFIWVVMERAFIVQVGLGFVIAGGTGNAYDRLTHHAVVDFLQFHYQDWYFPAFNVADVCINIGVGIVLIDLLFFASNRSKTIVS
jgi:signal peptidase II